MAALASEMDSIFNTLANISLNLKVSSFVFQTQQVKAYQCIIKRNAAVNSLNN